MLSAISKEIHALLWSKPIIKNGVFDPGWNCRDHALVVAALSEVSEENPLPYIAHGKNMLVLGPNGKNPSVGFGQDSGSRDGHTWNLSSQGGIFDYSLRVPDNKKNREWRFVSNPIVEGGECINVDGAEIVEARHPLHYENNIAIGTHNEGGFRICYMPMRIEPFNSEMLLNPFQWVDSPLSNKMKDRFPEHIYVNMVMHLMDIRRGRAKSISHKSQIGAWNTVAKRSGKDVDDYLSLSRRKYT